MYCNISYYLVKMSTMCLYKRALRWTLHVIMSGHCLNRQAGVKACSIIYCPA